MHRTQRSGLKPGGRVVHTVGPQHFAMANPDTSPSPALEARLTATSWPDSDELLLIVETATELADFLRTGFSTLDGDHLEIPWNDLAAVSRMDNRITLTIGEHQIATTTVSDEAWHEADSCIVGIMQPTPGSEDSQVAGRFLDALDGGHAAVSETAIYGVVNNSP